MYFLLKLLTVFFCKSCIPTAISATTLVTASPLLKISLDISFCISKISFALKFSKSCVDINLIINSEKIKLEIIDDGKGFPYDVTDKIRDPFLKNSDFYLMEVKNKTSEEGMGLGLFIANILLEKTKGKLKFSNVKQIENNGKKQVKGAKVEVSWDRSSIEVLKREKKDKVKENPRNVS